MVDSKQSNNMHQCGLLSRDNVNEACRALKLNLSQPDSRPTISPC